MALIKLDRENSGLSAYDVWLSEGNTGTKNDFINSLRGTVKINEIKHSVEALDGSPFTITLVSSNEDIIYLALVRQEIPQLLIKDKDFTLIGDKIGFAANGGYKSGDLVVGATITRSIAPTQTPTRPGDSSAVSTFTTIDATNIKLASNWDNQTGVYTGPALTTTVRAELEVYATSTTPGYKYSTDGSGKVNRYASL